jgi:hypothetical protein
LRDGGAVISKEATQSCCKLGLIFAITLLSRRIRWRRRRWGFISTTIRRALPFGRVAGVRIVVITLVIVIIVVIIVIVIIVIVIIVFIIPIRRGKDTLRFEKVLEVKEFRRYIFAVGTIIPPVPRVLIAIIRIPFC